MKSELRQYGIGLLSRWVEFVQKKALRIVIVAVLLSAGILLYAVKNVTLDADLTAMLSENLPFRKLEKDFLRAFPNLKNTLVIVIDGDSAERAIDARNRLAASLAREKKLFRSIYEPGSGAFFERNGLLYMNVDQLQDLADNMSSAQPLLALLSRDLSLKGFFSVVETVVQNSKQGELNNQRIDSMYEKTSAAFDSAAEQRPYDLPWQRIMLGGKGFADQQRQFIILQPSSAAQDLSAGGREIGAIHELLKRLGLADTPGLKVRITGDAALSYENMKAVRDSMGLATLVSLLLVSLAIYIGLARSGRLIVASLATLIMGLIWTTGFAVAFVGSLNMISITFAVLYIGLGIDYGIQFCLRYRELLLSGANRDGVILATALDVGKALFLSCVTTAIGFYSFIPTAYAGVAQLGLISGTGMFISFFANITLLPAFLTLFPLKETASSKKTRGVDLLIVPYKYSKAIAAGSVILTLSAAVLLFRIYFDYNPLNLYSRTSESVVTAKDLFKDTEAPPWTISVLVKGAKNARGLAVKLKKLGEVKMAVTLFDFVPDHQSEKIGIISDMALFIPPAMGQVVIKQGNYEQNMKALDKLENSLRKSFSYPGTKHAAVKLYESIRRFRKSLKTESGNKKSLALLQNNLLANLPGLFRMLSDSLKASPFGISELPEGLVSQYLSGDGRYRVQVFPARNIMNNEALVRFVKAVQKVAPGATDSPVTIYESGRAIISSFEHATLYALVAVTTLLLIESGSLLMTFFILVPLIVAMLLTGASSVLLGVPLNFANVIVVPLLLGIGVHSGIIYVIRYQTAPPADGNMLRTSTARSVLYSQLTTMISTGSLAFSSHRGIASIGILLTLCLGFLIVSSLVMLPAVMNVRRGPRGREKE
jgi:hopanoid biosynthesis associated RND transporter like protein HpnN